jgi:hypothetical protein
LRTGNGTPAQSGLVAARAARFLSVARRPASALCARQPVVAVPAGTRMHAGDSVPGGLGHRRSPRRLHRNGRIDHRQTRSHGCRPTFFRKIPCSARIGCGFFFGHRCGFVQAQSFDPPHFAAHGSCRPAIGPGSSSHFARLVLSRIVDHWQKKNRCDLSVFLRNIYVENEIVGLVHASRHALLSPSQYLLGRRWIRSMGCVRSS